MSTAISITESQIRSGASPESYRRGYEYYRNGAVVGLVRRGMSLEAEVEGSQYEPYQVTIDFDQAGVTAAECSCPYDWGGWCKHIVAALLTALHAPDEIEERPPLAELLEGLDRTQLLALVMALVKQQPGLADEIEAQVETVRAQSQTATQTATLTQAAYDAGQEPTPASTRPVAAPAVRRTPIDPKPFRQQVRHALRSLDRLSSSEAYWQIDGVVRQIAGLVEQANAFTRAGDGHNALTILEAITDEYIKEWMTLDDSDGIVSGFFADLTEPWTEAILAADLTAEERAEWADKFEDWQIELKNYDLDAAFEAPLAAAEEGWDAPHVQAALRGDALAGPWQEADDEDETDDDWEDEDENGRDADDAADDVEDQVTRARLAVLAQQGRTAEYLNLARAAGQMIPLVAMLIALGRNEEAETEAMKQLRRAADALTVAQAFREHNDLPAALRIAEHGLLLAGPKRDLADWLSELAHGLGQPEAALRAAVIAFRESPSEEGYLKVRKRALATGAAPGGDRAGGPEATWLPLRDELLAFVRSERTILPESKIGIFLSENLLTDAIAAADTAYITRATLERLMDAACATRPAWVIEAAQRQAEAIMDAGRAQYYADAVAWLERAQAAYRASGRLADWRAYLEGVRVKHGRKYKLMALLNRLDA